MSWVSFRFFISALQLLLFLNPSEIFHGTLLGMKTLLPLFFLFFMTSTMAQVPPPEAHLFSFQIQLINFPKQDEKKITHALKILKKVFSSPEFKKRVLSYEFEGKRNFHMNRGLSNLEIYQLILSGMEELSPHENHSMDVELELYSDFESNVLGFTRPDTHRIWMNKKYFDEHTGAELSSNLVHEWIHKLGFDHERKKNLSRKHSVPYAIGYIVKELAKEYE